MPRLFAPLWDDDLQSDLFEGIPNDNGECKHKESTTIESDDPDEAPSVMLKRPIHAVNNK